MIATTRMLTLSTLFAMLVGLMLVHQAGAREVKTNVPISTRESIQRDHCLEEGGGRTFSVTYTYNDDGSVATATTKCRGGAYNGTTCVNTASTTTCTSVLMPAEQSTHTTVGGGTVAPPEADSSQGTATAGTFQTTAAPAQVDEQP